MISGGDYSSPQGETMAKKSLFTPNSQIRSALRMLFLRSRERATAIKRDKYTCVKCGSKQSKAKGKEVRVEVHHKEGVLNWEGLFNAVREYLLCSPDELEVKCVTCHKEEHNDKK